MNYLSWLRGACVGDEVCVCTLSVDGMKPKMEETLASLSEPKWHESDLISLREVSQQQAWRTAVCGGATRIRPQKYLG